MASMHDMHVDGYGCFDDERAVVAGRTPGAAALIIVFLLATVLLLANSALLPMATAERSEQRCPSGQAATSYSLRRWLSS